MRIITRGLWLGAVLCALGCIGRSRATRDAPPPASCRGDADCQTGRGEVCRSPSTGLFGLGDDAICVIPSRRASGAVVLEVHPVPPDLPPVQLGPISLADGQRRTLVLPAPVQVDGTLTYRGRAPAGIPRARLRFTLRGPLADRPLGFEALTEAAPLEGRFARLLPPGRYDIVLLPPPATANGALAPSEWPFEGGLELPTTSAPTWHMTFPSDLELLQGRAMVDDGSTLRPAAGWRVWAVAGPTGARRTLSVPADVQPDGSFALRLAPTPSGHPGDLQLAFGPAVPGTALPTLVVTPEFEASGRLRATLAAREATELSGRVVAASSSGPPEAAARVTLSTARDAPFTFATTVEAAGDGSFSAKLPPGTYRAVAMPAPRGDDGRTLELCLPASDGAVIVPASGTMLLVCEPPVPFFGEVRAGDEPLEGVRVEATRRADAGVGEALAVRTRTDGAGLFALSLAKGIWDLRLEPPADTKRPVTFVRGLEVEEVAAATVVMELGEPFELYGKLLDDKGRPVSATLEGWAPDDDGRSRKVGETLSGPDGAFALILPAGTDG